MSKPSTGLSLVDYTSVSASSPPKQLTGLWAGPHAGGTFYVEIFDDGDLRTCLSAPPYYHAMDGKYADEALYLEDGTRIEFQPVGARRLPRWNAAHRVTPPATVWQVPLTSSANCPTGLRISGRVR
jgi:hypothetical protein